jgi:hypothetical protein
MSRVREFVVQLVQAGQSANAVSFALTFIAVEMGLHVTHRQNPLSAVGTALQGVVAAARAYTIDGQTDASEMGDTVALRTSAVPKGTLLH